MREITPLSSCNQSEKESEFDDLEDEEDEI